MTCGLIATVVLGELHIAAANMVGPWFGIATEWVRPDWLPRVSFTWYAFVGALVVFVVGVLFKTPPQVLEAAQRQARQADAGDARPMSLRGEA
ncbi:MAG: hypothetical protein FJX72_18685 [Armatimonadetes bacterium]|nr:hypothetical protein [Armatimonadota bacterium]